MSDNVSFASGESPEMNAAIADARASLDEFWSVWSDPDDTSEDFGVKVAYSVPDEPVKVEHIWVAVLNREGNTIQGSLAADSMYLPTLRAGSTVTVDAIDITDWTYTKDGVAYGHHTTKVLINDMSPEYRAHVMASLGWSDDG